MKQLRKYFLAKREVKAVTSTHKVQANIVNKIASFEDLCQPTKQRLRDMLTVFSIQPHFEVPEFD